MKRIFEFFYRFRSFTVFVLLEILCFSLIVNNNSFQGASYFNTSNVIVGTVLNISSNVKGYFKLRDVNDQLLAENRKLREQLTQERQRTSVIIESKIDTTKIYQYAYVGAKVVNMTTNKSSNYFTIDRGASDGLAPGMGVMSKNGIAGKIKNCSPHFSTVVSLLHGRMEVFGKIKRGDIKGVCKWGGDDPLHVKLLYVGRHHKVYVGDTLVTSGNSSTYPEGQIIGFVKSVKDDGKNYDIKVRLATDYTSLTYVYAINNKLAAEKDSLETTIIKQD